MKTVYVKPAELRVDGELVGTITRLNIKGIVGIGATESSFFVTLRSEQGPLAQRYVPVTSGISSSGVDWQVVENNILSFFGLTKETEQA